MTFRYSFNLAGQPQAVSVSSALYQNSSSLATGSYSADGQNRYQSAGGSTLGYDGNANVNAIGAQGYGYDALNRMTSAGAATLVYDALSRLSEVTGGGSTTKFLYGTYWDLKEGGTAPCAADPPPPAPFTLPVVDPPRSGEGGTSGKESAPQGNALKNWLCGAGNAVAEFADTLGNAD